MSSSVIVSPTQLVPLSIRSPCKFGFQRSLSFRWRTVGPPPKTRLSRELFSTGPRHGVCSKIVNLNFPLEFDQETMIRTTSGPVGLLAFSLKVSRDTWDAASRRARLPTVARRRELCNENNGKRKSWLCQTVRVGGLRKDFQFSGWCPGNCTELLHEDLRHPKGGMLLYHHASHFVNKLPGSTGVLKRFETK